MENSRRKIALTEINTSKESQGKSQEPKGFPPTNDVGTTPQDLPSQHIMEIFSRLPMKTIFACGCVCKLWQRLILLTCIYQKHHPLAFCVEPSRSEENQKCSICLTFAMTKRNVVNHGLNLRRKLISLTLSFVLLIHVTSCFACVNVTQRIPFMCNPILSEYITLPKVKKGVRIVGAGFGCSLKTKQYKEVRFLRIMGTDPVTCETYDFNEAEIYFLGTGSWRSIAHVLYNIHLNIHFNTFVNGALHWEVIGKSSTDFIHAFDFGSEQFRAVPEPSAFGPLEKQFIDQMRCGVLRGCLSISDLVSVIMLIYG